MSKEKTILEAATDMLHNLPEAVVDKDISAIIDFAVNELGADLHKGNTLDFGQGSVIKVSKKGGKILFDGGMSTGKEYFKNAKDAIASLAAGMDESITEALKTSKYPLVRKTLLEAASDILLNRTESTINEYANSSIEKTMRKIQDIFDLLDEYVMKKNSRLERVLGSGASEYQNEIKKLKEYLIKAEGVFIYDIAQALDMEDILEDNISESTKEMDDIAAKVAELKVGDKTNFGVVVAKGSNSITFKAKDLPKTKITFNQRKMGSRDYVLSALRKA